MAQLEMVTSRVLMGQLDSKGKGLSPGIVRGALRRTLFASLVMLIPAQDLEAACSVDLDTHITTITVSRQHQ